MRARIWGCRGSLAAPGPETVRYGGNTSCLEVRLSDDSLIILDAGTGIRPLGLGLEIAPGSTIHLLLSHLHLDHLEGLGFFGPLWRPDVDLHIWGPASPTRSLQERIAMYMSPPLFPVHVTEVPSHPTFHDAPEIAWNIGTARILAQSVSHNGPTVGYRIEEAGRALAYIPDHEPGLGVDLRRVEPDWISGHALAAGADVLLHDSQYTEEEYPERLGWGHSSVDQVVAFGLAAYVKRLIMFHHDPMHSDARLEAHERRALELWDGDGQGPLLAREGMEIDIR